VAVPTISNLGMVPKERFGAPPRHRNPIGFCLGEIWGTAGTIRQSVYHAPSLKIVKLPTITTR